MARKTLTGKIVSDKMQQTVVVAVETPKMHPTYPKAIKSTKRFKARNDMGAQLGQTVVIEECKPYSKHVTWEVIEVKEAK